MPFGISTVTADGDPQRVCEATLEYHFSGFNTRAYPSIVFIMVGMSSQEREIEMSAIQWAEKLKIPYGLYGDIPGAFTRPHFKEGLKNATAYFGTAITDKARGKKYVGKNGTCTFFVTGNPLRDDMVIQNFSRAQKEARKLLGIPPDEFAILMPGNKDLLANIARVKEFLEFWRKYSMIKSHIMFAPHPGDPAVHAIDCRDRSKLEIYKKMMRHETDSKSACSVLHVPASSVLAAFNAVVDCGSSLAIEACINRIPSVTWMTKEDKENFIESNGHTKLEVLDNECSITRSVLEESLRSKSYSLDELFYTSYKHQIEKHYPHGEEPDKYRSVKKMIEILKEIT